jgi:hypothetical protein
MLKEKLPFILINTLLLHIPLLALTDGQNDWQRNKHTLCAWAGGTFFQLCCCVIFLFWREIGFFLHTYVLRVQYSCGVVLVLWLRQEIVFDVTYVLSVQYSCAVVSVFWLWREIVLKMRTRFYKKTIELLYYDPLADVCILHDLTLLALYLSILYISLVPRRSTSWS